MIDRNEYLTPSEFAERRNVSKQTIYQQMKKGLKPYVIKDNGKLYISVKALSNPDNLENQSTFNQSSINNKSTFNQVDLPLIIPESEILRSQIAEKDKQIALLLEQLKTANNQNVELGVMLKREQEINRNNQLLIGEQTQIIKTYTEKKKPLLKRLFGRKEKENEAESETI